MQVVVGGRVTNSLVAIVVSATPLSCRTFSNESILVLRCTHTDAGFLVKVLCCWSRYYVGSYQVSENYYSRRNASEELRRDLRKENEGRGTKSACRCITSKRHLAMAHKICGTITDRSHCEMAGFTQSARHEAR
jgi:hypothetical protein